MEDFNIENDENFQKYLKELNCRGCYNRCPLDNPACARSKIWIREAIEKFKEKNKD